MRSKKAMGLMLAVLLCLGLWTGCTCSANVKPNPTAAPTQKVTSAPTMTATVAPVYTDAPVTSPEASLVPDSSAGIDTSASPEASADMDIAGGDGSITGGD